MAMNIEILIAVDAGQCTCLLIADLCVLCTSPQLPKEQVIRMYECMVRLNVMDQVFYDAQRQGRISFYMTSSGEEATATCSAAALEAEDLIMCQYREAGAFMWRGFSIGQFADQCFSNAKDKGKGRQMPVHYGSAALHIQTVSSPLTTQVPQASGAAYAFKINNKQNVVCCYFGEGAASEGDFHAGLNFAATLNCPVLFFCRNNGYAISTPSSEQYKGDGIASRGAGYGMRTIRIDGNDFLAVFEATREARRLSLEHSVPVLIEAMTYRGGHHSTSDDSTRYRSQEEIRYWQENNNPLVRTRMFMEGQQWWDATQEVKLQQDARQVVLAELSRAEHEKKPAIDHLFTDVYDKMPRNLQEQQAELHAHLAKHGQHYDLGAFETDEASPAK